MDRGAWWATVHGVAKSGTKLSDYHFCFHSQRSIAIQAGSLLGSTRKAVAALTACRHVTLGHSSLGRSRGNQGTWGPSTTRLL